MLKSLLALPLLGIVGNSVANENDAAAEVEPKAVEARIRRLRQGSLTVKAAPGAEVKVRQLRHEFLFGTAVANGLAENASDAMSAADRKQFLKILGEHFNYAVHENALKWYDCEKARGVVDYSVADRIWELCRDLNIPMRGHCVYWDKENCCMDWLKPLNNEQLRSAVVKRGLDVVRHFQGRISEFDLNNEMCNGDFFRRRLGYGVVNEMAWIVKAANPDAVLFLNDYGVLVEGGFNAESYLIQIDTLLKSGVPFGGIGCQGHSGTDCNRLMDPVHVQKTLNKLTRFNLPIKITECLFDSGDADTQAQELYKIFPLYFAHPAIEAIVMWGFWEGSHWRPWSALWKTDWTLTPQGAAFRDLVFNQWWTKAEGKADKNGVLRTDAFFGEYEISVKGKTQKAFLGKKDKAIQVACP